MSALFLYYLEYFARQIVKCVVAEQQFRDWIVVRI
jgi:hypothetical protein